MDTGSEKKAWKWEFPFSHAFLLFMGMTHERALEVLEKERRAGEESLRHFGWSIISAAV